MTQLNPNIFSLKSAANKALTEIKEHLYTIETDYDWDDELILEYKPVEGEELAHLVSPILRIINNYNEWIPFTFDEEGVLDCRLPDVDEEILISDGETVVVDTFLWDEEGYYLDSTNWDLEGLAWMPLPKPHSKALDLAIRLDDFVSDYDTDEYAALVDDKEEHVLSIKHDLEDGEIEPFIDYLSAFIAEGGPSAVIDDAIQLLNDIKNFR